MKPLEFRGAWVTPLLTLLAAMVAGMLYAGVALAAPVSEVEPNDSSAAAQNIDGSFTLDQDDDIGDTTTNTSTTIPHATIEGTGNNSVDYYSFTVSQGARGIFDIDYAAENGLDSFLVLYDSDGTELARTDDSDPAWGQGGSISGLDSYLEYTFATPGTYYIEVGSCCTAPGEPTQPVWAGTSYRLQVSIESTGPQTTEECKNDGWKNFENPDGSLMFKNQGDCVSYVATHGKNEPGQNVPGPGHPEPEKAPNAD